MRNHSAPRKAADDVGVVEGDVVSKIQESKVVVKTNW